MYEGYCDDTVPYCTLYDMFHSPLTQSSKPATVGTIKFTPKMVSYLLFGEVEALT